MLGPISDLRNALRFVGFLKRIYPGIELSVVVPAEHRNSPKPQFSDTAHYLN